MDKMVIMRKHDGKEEMCFVLDKILEINKENSDTIKIFSELLKVNKTVNNIDEEYYFKIYEDDPSNSEKYFNSIIKGEYKSLKEGSLYEFLMLYINKYFKKYTYLPGYTITDKMNAIIEDSKKNKIKR